MDDQRRRLLTWPRVVGWGAVLGLGLFLVVWTPLSPLALTRADVLLALGRAGEAGELYEQVGLRNVLPELRREGWMRAALVWMVDQPDPLRARTCVQQVLQDAEAPEAQRALAWERLGRLLGGPLARADEAAGAWRMAYETAPDDPSAGLRLVNSARVMTEAGHSDEAHAVWERVARRFAEHRTEAKLAQADILLSKGRLGQAREAFKAAQEAAEVEADKALASEGREVVEERMERLKTALSALESRDLPPDLRARLEKAERAPAHEIQDAGTP